ncbi:MAG: transposase [Betaproteobacteria bacterium]|nr:transposase [Betaproteobacteria bacterium]
MTEQISGLNERVVVSHKQDGRCCYDPQAKRELIEASLQPGVSVAKLALMHGINANLLRKWIGKHLGQSFAGSSVKRTAERPAAFIPVVPVSAHRSPITPPELAARLPAAFGWNGRHCRLSSWRMFFGCFPPCHVPTRFPAEGLPAPGCGGWPQEHQRTRPAG